MTKYLIDDELCQDLEATLQVIAGHGTPNPEVAAQLLHGCLPRCMTARAVLRGCRTTSRSCTAMSGRRFPNDGKEHDPPAPHRRKTGYYAHRVYRRVGIECSKGRNEHIPQSRGSLPE